MLIGYVSDEYYAALADVLIEFRGQDGSHVAAPSTASDAVRADLPVGSYEVCLSKPGFGSKCQSSHPVMMPTELTHFFASDASPHRIESSLKTSVAGRYLDD